MIYGMLVVGSCLFTDIVDQLHEDSKMSVPWSGSQDICTREFPKKFRHPIAEPELPYKGDERDAAV